METHTMNDGKPDTAHGGVDVLTPGDPRWDAARSAYNLAVDQRPAAIALPHDARSAAAAVAAAERLDLHVAAQGTGHGAAALGDLENTMLIRTQGLTGVTVDGDRGRARVGAGVRWEDVVRAAAASHLVGLHGSSARVGVTGYSLNGGIGWYGRKLGLQANSVTAVELVTVAGEHVRADADHEPDLFWACRGGGGAFGVVTALEFQLHDVGDIVAGALLFPIERAAEVLHAWREWTATVPDAVSSLGRILRVPDLPDAPAPMRGRSFALIEAVVVGMGGRAVELFEPLRRLGPSVDTLAAVAPAAVTGLHMDPHDPVAYQRGDVLLSELSADAVDRVVELAGPGVRTPLVSVEIRHLGGALGRAPEGHGALGRIDGEALVVSVGMQRDAATGAAVNEANRALRSALSPYAAPTGAANFAERAADFSMFFDEPTARRLSAIKQAVDPGGRFVPTHGHGAIRSAA